MQVKETLSRWVIRFNRQLKDGQLDLLVDDYTTDLKSLKWTVQRFNAAAIRVTVNTKFFPQVADLIGADKDVQNSARNEYSATDDDDYNRRTTMSDTHKIFFGLDAPVGLAHKGKNARDDYDEYGPSLAHFKAMTKQENIDYGLKHAEKMAKAAGKRGGPMESIGTILKKAGQ